MITTRAGPYRSFTGNRHDGPVTNRVLIADDDDSLRSALARALALEGYDVTAVADGGEALAAMRANTVEVAIVDIGMPVLDGLTVTKVVRAEQHPIPILILTARGETPDRVEGLDAGADDYLAKPFALAELLARLRALLRRPTPPNGDEVLTVADLRLDPASRQAWRNGEELNLTKTEFDLLELLMRNSGIVLPHSTIYERIWGYDFGPDSKNLAVYIGYLRRKLETTGDVPLVHTVRGVGYTLRGP